MRKCGFIIFALVLGVALASCSKKQQALEELQQPMSPEDLNRLKTQGAATVPGENIAPGAQPEAAGKILSVPGEKLEPLPPSGPYKPTDKEIQTALKNAGYYPGAIDGKVGPKTKQAVEEFQKANGLQVDGKVGPKTWGMLAKFLYATEAGATTATTTVTE
jgi:peptidoglycan hydrolase-like protein with peptidoglycan-binding domain